MKKILIGLLLLLAAAGAMILMATRSQPEWTTDSPEALAALERGLDAQMKFYGQEAREGYKEALERDPEFVAAKLMLLLFDYRTQGKEDQLEELRQVDLERLNSRERFLLRYILAREEGDAAEADRLVSAYVEENPKDPYALATCSNQAWREGNWDQAEAHYRDLLELDPNWVAAQNHLGYMAMAQGKFKEAEELFETYQFIAPDQANPHDSMGELLTVLGRYDEAEEALERALSVKPDFCASYEHLFSLASLAGKSEAYAGIVQRSRENCGEHMAEVMECLGAMWTDYIGRDYDAPWSEERAACSKLYYREPFLLHRLAVLTGRGEVALELEELVDKQVDKGGMEGEMLEAILIHMKGVRAIVEGDPERAVSLLSKADARLLYWGQGPAVLKMFNQMNLAAALERAGEAGRAEEVLSRVGEVNPSFASFYPAISAEFESG